MTAYANWAARTLRQRHERDVQAGEPYPHVAPTADDILRVSFDIEHTDDYLGCAVYIEATITLTSKAKKRLGLDRNWLYVTIPRDSLMEFLDELTQTGDQT